MLDKQKLLPREKALKVGFNGLSNKELIAIILRVGSKSCNVLELSEILLTENNGIEGLSKLSYSDLIKIKGIKKDRAIGLIATFELAARLRVKNLQNEALLASSENIYNFFRYYLEDKEQECFVVVFVNTKHFMTGYRFISQGTLDTNIIHPRDIFREAIKNNAARIILVHNHPSGDPTPSRVDIETTEQLKEIGNFLHIQVIDHIIVGRNKFASLKNKYSNDKK